MNLRPFYFLLLIMTFCSLPAFPSDTLSPAGRWKTVDDKSGKPKSIMNIVLRGDTLVATIDSLYREPGEEPDPVCDKCTDWRKNMKVKGLTITDAMVRRGNEWSGGRITDPDNGKAYRCIVKLLDKGTQLDVHGYIGFAIIGRSQYWYRVK
ncbi:MAG TPA: DUF2147 domain-containing protein [Chitinivibrionales bacterium]|jgi:hypothetical protein|nr:DUF2147 domain-containing protein [Chitinivibrionales bacterium]